MEKKYLNSLRKIHGRLYDGYVNTQKTISSYYVAGKGQIKSLIRKEENISSEEDYPVDFVVLWLDSTDPKWQADKDSYLPKDEITKKNNSAARFRNWDIFKYWFRAVEKYAPWVRNVYLVTYGHHPSFIDLNSPKLKFVKHSDFMPSEYLPTFSCFPTELNLWRIKGISEHIVYFNDDMFLTRPVKKTDFFAGGLPKYSAVAMPPYPHLNMAAWPHNLFNNAGVINELFDVRKSIKRHPDKWFSHLYDQDYIELNKRAYRDGAILGMYFSHLGVPYRCSTMKTVWDSIPRKLDSTCKNKFRTMDDIMHQIFQMWEIFNGTFEPVGIGYFGWFANINLGNVDSVTYAVKSKKYRMVCINDPEVLSDEDYLILKDKVYKVLDDVFPNKSSFEK